MDNWEIEIEALVILMKRGDKSIRKVYMHLLTFYDDK